MTVHNLLFCAPTLCMNNITNTFLLVSSSIRSKQLLCFVHRQGQKSEQKHTTNFSIFRTNDAIAWGIPAYMLRGFLRMSRRENASEIHEIFYVFGPQVNAFMSVGIWLEYFHGVVSCSSLSEVRQCRI